MARHNARIGTLRILNGAANSPALTSLQFGRVGLGMAAGITIYGPAAVDGVITVEVLPYGDSTWRTLQSGGTDVTIAAGKAVVISPPAFADLRLHGSVNQTADRDFFVDGQMDMA